MFQNALVGNVIPPEFHQAIEKGFREAVEKGMAGFPVVGVKVVITDGQAHAVDSNEIAFRLAAQYAFREGFRKAKPIILEPIMAVDIEIPVKEDVTCIRLFHRRGVQLKVLHPC